MVCLKCQASSDTVDHPNTDHAGSMLLKLMSVICQELMRSIQFGRNHRNKTKIS